MKVAILSFLEIAFLKDVVQQTGENFGSGVF